MKKEKTFLLLFLTLTMVFLSGCGSATRSVPPGLTIICGEEEQKGLQGTTSWSYRESGEKWGAYEACGSGPLAEEETLSLRVLKTEEEQATLDFVKEPDSVQVRCWSDVCWEDSVTEEDRSPEDLTLDGNTLELKPGGYIYEVSASWDQKDYKGNTSYSFYIIKE